jgi:hypothetical protein
MDFTKSKHVAFIFFGVFQIIHKTLNWWSEVN